METQSYPNELLVSLRTGRDIFIEEIIDAIPRPKRKRSKTYDRNSNRGRNRKQSGVNRNPRYYSRQSMSPIERGVLTILRFLREDGYEEFRLQRDIGDKGVLKGKPGFIIGSPESSEEVDVSAALRETQEEALVDASIGTIEQVGVIHVKSHYHVTVFVKTVAFDTADGKGQDVYEHDRCSKEEIEELIQEKSILLTHATAWKMAVAGKFI